MHESGLFKDIIRKLELLVQQNPCAAIKKIKVKVGNMSCVSVPHLKNHFKDYAIGTMVESAEWEIEPIKGDENAYSQDIILDSIEVVET